MSPERLFEIIRDGHRVALIATPDACIRLAR
jgi:hypothetical protein